MNNFIIIGLLIGLIPGAYAETPQATLNMTIVNNQSWPTQYQLSLTIPKDHHAYLNEGDEHIYIPVTLDPEAKLASAGVAIEKLEKPQGDYDSEVKAQVLRGQGNFQLWLKQTGTQTPQVANLAIRYQMCNELTSVCYRPQRLSVDLPLAGSAPALANNPPQGKNTPAHDASTSFMEQLLGLFKNNQDNSIILFSLMLLAGVLSVATPCVYPMLPITSMFIVNRANGVAKKEKQHAFVYLLGIVGTYMLLGLVAGLSGGAFNTIMQSAWVNIGFALFFTFFAMALLGYYELSFMQNEVHSLDQRSARVKGLTGTWLMGSVAGLVISPCVGPIVFALLLQVADKMAAKAASLALINQQLGFLDKLGIASQGSLMMAGFGLGVGLPFFLISVLKFKKLPKAGYWMNKVKLAFGLAILYFAYTYLEKGLSVLGVGQITSTLAFGMLGVWIAIVPCNVLTLLPENPLPNQKMGRYCGVMSLLIGGWLVIASVGKIGALSVAACTAAGNVEASPVVEQEAGIAWYRNFATAQKLAQQTGKPMFIDFYASWCANCVAFKAETAQNPGLNQALREKTIAVKLVDKEPDFEAFREKNEHRTLKIGLPYFAILTPDGKVSWSGTDYKAAETIIAEINKLAV